MNQTTDFLMLNSGAFFGQKQTDHPLPMNSFSMIDLYELPTTDLTRYKCLSIDGLADQEFLYKHRELIRDFLNQRKVLVFSGNLYLDWLPGGAPFIPKEINNYLDYDVSIHHPHPIFEGVLPEDMTYKKGVTGFFARGHHPLPRGAEVLLTLAGDVPITYIDRHSTQGTILAHSGNDLFCYRETENTTARISGQLVQWVQEEYERIREGSYA